MKIILENKNDMMKRKLIKGITWHAILWAFSTNTISAIGSYVPHYVNSNYIFELVTDCLGKETYEEVVNRRNLNNLYLKYDMNGYLDEVGFGLILDGFLYSQFLECEWEQIFDYFDKLPPMPIPNPSKNDSNEAEKGIMDKIDRVKGIYFDGSLINRWKYRDEVYSKDVPYFDWLMNSHYSYDIKDSGENPDSLFGKINWHDVRSRYFEAYNSGNLKPNIPKFKMITPEDFKKDGYCWEKIPISKCTVNIQMPIGTTISIAPDTLSASCIFPDSTRISIQYTKGEPYTKLWDGEKDPRDRLITYTTVTDKYVLLSGVFMNNKKEIFWTRIRYRYGVTITLYSSPIREGLNDFTVYEKVVLQTATIVMRPKYKTIYLKD